MILRYLTNILLTIKKREIIMKTEDYKLTVDQASDHKIQRLLKQIQVNSKTDRIEALQLLDTVKQELKLLREAPPRLDEEGNPIGYLESFTKLVQSATIALNQAGISNERLLKLATLLQKYSADRKKSGTGPLGKGGKVEQSSIFQQLKDLSLEDDDDD